MAKFPVGSRYLLWLKPPIGSPLKRAKCLSQNTLPWLKPWPTGEAMAYWQSHGLLAKPSATGKTMAYWRTDGLLAKPWPAGKTMAYWRSHGLLAKP